MKILTKENFSLTPFCVKLREKYNINALVYTYNYFHYIINTF